MNIGDSVRILKDRDGIIYTKGVAFSSSIKINPGAIGIVADIETSRSGQKFCDVKFEIDLGNNITIELFVGLKESNLERIK